MNITELTRLAEAATPGPWAVKEDSTDGKDEAYCEWHDVGPLAFMGEKLNKDTAFIAAANPATILKLLAVVEAAEDFVNHPTTSGCFVALRKAVNELES